MFDPKRNREVFHEFTFDYMQHRLSSFDLKNPVGNFAISMLNDVISGYLVNFKDEVDIYLPTVHEWLDIAIERKEILGEGDYLIFHHANLFKSKALAIWMSDHINATAYWQKAFELWSDFDSKYKMYAKNSLKTDFLDDFMQLCVQSGQYKAGVERFEQYYGKKEISIKKKMSAREYGYVLCRNHFESKYNVNELLAAGRAMLSKYLEEPWLRMGLYCHAATWLKIVYWDQGHTTTAYETILRAYENMPNIQALE